MYARRILVLLVAVLFLITIQAVSINKRSYDMEKRSDDIDESFEDMDMRDIDDAVEKRTKRSRKSFGDNNAHAVCLTKCQKKYDLNDKKKCRDGCKST
jgi:hypothetical protein